MSTLFDDVNKKISELFRQEIEETSEEYHPRIKDLQTILISFSKILQNQDATIGSVSKKVNSAISIMSREKVGLLRKTLDENIMSMQKLTDDLKDFGNRVVPELKNEISALWRFVQTMQDHVMKLEKTFKEFEPHIQLGKEIESGVRKFAEPEKPKGLGLKLK